LIIKNALAHLLLAEGVLEICDFLLESLGLHQQLAIAILEKKLVLALHSAGETTGAPSIITVPFDFDALVHHYSGTHRHGLDGEE